MEYCPGGDLSSFIKSRRTIPEKYVRRFVQQIACAIKHLHMRGIAHMDLKPQNILLTSVNNPSLKLAGSLCLFFFLTFHVSRFVMLLLLFSQIQTLGLRNI